MSQSLEQKRAAYAWGCVQGVSSEYVNLAKAAPSLIMSNGLMQTLAFFKSKDKDKDKDPHAALLGHVLRWLIRPEAACSFLTSSDFSHAMAQLAAPNVSSEQYLHATREALAILKWIRQFAAAVKPEGGGHA